MSARLRFVQDLLAHWGREYSCEFVYDLFCDHGKVGVQLQKKLSVPVYFNDQVDILLKELPVPETQKIYGKAEQIELQGNSLIFMGGVGGHLINRCLACWEHRQPEIFKTLTFVTCPESYPWELREYCEKNAFELVEESIVWERRRSYQVMVFKGLRGFPWQSPVLNHLLWSKQGEKGLKYLKSKSKSLKMVLKGDCGDDKRRHSELLLREIEYFFIPQKGRFSTS